MRFKYESEEERKKRLTNWHTWFAWFPVPVSPNESVWFEYVWRKGTDMSAFIAFSDSKLIREFVWEYKLKEKDYEPL